MASSAARAVWTSFAGGCPIVVPVEFAPENAVKMPPAGSCPSR